MPNNNRTQLGARDLYFDGEDVGVTANGKSVLSIKGNNIVIDDVEQFDGVFDEIEKSIVPQLKFAARVANPRHFARVLTRGRLDSESSGDKTVVFFGRKINYLAQDNTFELLSRPVGVPSVDTSQDFKAWKCSITLADGMDIDFNRDQPLELNLIVRIFPDETKPAGREYAAWGSWDISSSSALFGFIQAGRMMLDNGKHVQALTMTLNQRIRLNHIYGFGVAAEDDNCDPIQFLLNGELTDGVYTALIDNLSFPSYLREGQYFQADAGGTPEWFKILTVDYSATDAATITFDRALFDSPIELTHADNVVCQVYDTIGFEDRVLSAVHTSGTPANVTVGDEYPGVGDTRKGVMAAIGAEASTSNLYSVFGGKQTPNTVITLADLT